MNKLHYFADSISLLSLPEKFTYPFHYTPHPLCVAAAGEVGRYLSTKGEWQGRTAEREDVWRFDCPYRRGGSRLSGSLLWHPGREESTHLFRASGL